MKRDQLIEMIDGTDPEIESALDDLCVQLQSRAKTQMSRASWASDLEQSFAYILIFIIPEGIFAKKVRRSVRFSIRSLLLGILVSVLLLIELVVLLVIAEQFSNEAYGLAGVVFIMFVEFAVIGSWFERIKRQTCVDNHGLHLYCVKCQYSLVGLESQLGNCLNVGPKQCPECGYSYPAIS